MAHWALLLYIPLACSVEFRKPVFGFHCVLLKHVYSDFGMKARMKSDTVRTHFTFGLIVNGDILQTNILTFMIRNY